MESKKRVEQEEFNQFLQCFYPSFASDIEEMYKYCKQNESLTFKEAKESLSSGEFAKTSKIMAKRFWTSAEDQMYASISRPIERNRLLFVQLMLEQLLPDVNGVWKKSRWTQVCQNLTTKDSACKIFGSLKSTTDVQSVAHVLSILIKKGEKRGVTMKIPN